MYWSAPSESCPVVETLFRIRRRIDGRTHDNSCRLANDQIYPRTLRFNAAPHGRIASRKPHSPERPRAPVMLAIATTGVDPHAG